MKTDGYGFHFSRLSAGTDARNVGKDQEIPYDAKFTHQGCNQNMLLVRRETHVSAMEELNSDRLISSFNLEN